MGADSRNRYDALVVGMTYPETEDLGTGIWQRLAMIGFDQVVKNAECVIETWPDVAKACAESLPTQDWRKEREILAMVARGATFGGLDTRLSALDVMNVLCTPVTKKRLLRLAEDLHCGKGGPDE